jgi:hypothetical protein
MRGTRPGTSGDREDPSAYFRLRRGARRNVESANHAAHAYAAADTRPDPAGPGAIRRRGDAELLRFHLQRSPINSTTKGGRLWQVSILTNQLRTALRGHRQSRRLAGPVTWTGARLTEEAQGGDLPRSVTRESPLHGTAHAALHILFASRDAAAAPTAIQDLAGHRDPSTTLRLDAPERGGERERNSTARSARTRVGFWRHLETRDPRI